MSLQYQFKYLLTKIGSLCSKNSLHQFNATLNYLEAGRWFKAKGFDLPSRFKNRYQLFDQIAPLIKDKQVLYLEFGVYQGETIRYWSRTLKNPQSLLHGFDSFEGLPENWNAKIEKSHFSVDGKIPVIDDKRVSFFKGWFEDTLPKYDVQNCKVLFVNIDADLYSSTKTVLHSLKNHMSRGTYLYFDEFCDRAHELKAFDEFLNETKMKFKVVGATQTLANVIFQRID